MKKNWYRLVCIGMCHIVLYMVLVPYVIYPWFGKPGVAVTTLIAVAFSIVMTKNLWFKKKDRPNKGLRR